VSAINTSLVRLRRPKRANEGLTDALDEVEREAMIGAATLKLEELFAILQIDHQNDHNTRDTPKRVAKMYVEEIMSGRFCDPPAITEFENVARFDSLIVTGPIEVRSTCAHHMMPIYGEAFIGILPAPDGRIIGLSKYDRVVHHFASRLQIQEELVTQIAEYLVEKTAPRGLAVRISAVHMCKTQRGVKSSVQSRMVSTFFHGAFHTDSALKAEFLSECQVLSRG
jgi:GTP cyclohydrolase I